MTLWGWLPSPRAHLRLTHVMSINNNGPGDIKIKPWWKPSTQAQGPPGGSPSSECGSPALYNHQHPAHQLLLLLPLTCLPITAGSPPRTWNSRPSRQHPLTSGPRSHDHTGCSRVLPRLLDSHPGQKKTQMHAEPRR